MENTFEAFLVFLRYLLNDFHYWLTNADFWHLVFAGLVAFRLVDMLMTKYRAWKYRGYIEPWVSHPNMNVFVESHQNSKLKTVSASLTGWRPTNEDTHSISIEKNSTLLCIFDGHGGSECSKFLKEDLPARLMKLSDEEWNNDEFIQNVIYETDRRLLAVISQTRNPKIPGSGGSCAVICNVKRVGNEYLVTCINIGDSRAVIGRRLEDGSFETVGLTEDHLPTLPFERERIVAAGGFVELDRVNGNLAMSRAFGDFYLKTGNNINEVDPTKFKVVVTPTITRANATDGDFLVIACDGLYESEILSREDVVNKVGRELTWERDPAEVATNLVKEVVERGSSDNVSVIIHQFRNFVKHTYKKEEYLVPAYRNPMSGFSNWSQKSYNADLEKVGMAGKYQEVMQIAMKQGRIPIQTDSFNPRREDADER